MALNQNANYIQKNSTDNIIFNYTPDQYTQCLSTKRDQSPLLDQKFVLDQSFEKDEILIQSNNNYQNKDLENKKGEINLKNNEILSIKNQKQQILSSHTVYSNDYMHTPKQTYFQNLDFNMKDQNNKQQQSDEDFYNNFILKKDKLMKQGISQSLFDSQRISSQRNINNNMKQFLNNYKINSRKKISLFVQNEVINYQNMIQVVNDYGADSFEEQKQSLVNIMSKIIQKVYINPTAKLKLFWDLIVILLKLSMIFCISIDVFFNPVTYLWGRDDILHLSLYTVIIFSLDLIMKFFTGFYTKGVIEKNVCVIANKYMRTYLKYDLVTIIGVVLITYYDNNLKYLFVVIVYYNLFKIIKKDKKIEECIVQEEVKNTLQLVKLFIYILIIVHTVCCCFYGVGKFEHFYLQQNNNWLNLQDLIDIPWQSQYLTSFYISAAIIMGEGIYVEPVTQLETIFYIGILLFTCMQIAFIINKMGLIIQTQNKKNENYKNDLYILNRFMKKKQIPIELQLRSRNYLEYLYQQQQEIITKEEELLLKQMSKSLYEEMQIVIYKSFIQSIPIFKEILSVKMQEQLVNLVTENSYTINDKIFMQNQFQNNIIFVKKGSIQIIYNNQNINHQMKQKGLFIKQHQIFGELEFLTGEQKDYQLISKDNTIIYQIDRNKFFEVLKNYKEDQEKILMLQNNLLYNNKILQNQKCNICDLPHNFQFCTKSHYIPEKLKIVQQSLFQNKQLKYQVRHGKKYNTYSKLIYIQEQLKTNCQILQKQFQQVQNSQYDIINNYQDNVYVQNQQIQDKQQKLYNNNDEQFNLQMVQLINNIISLSSDQEEQDEGYDNLNNSQNQNYDGLIQYEEDQGQYQSDNNYLISNCQVSEDESVLNNYQYKSNQKIKNQIKQRNDSTPLFTDSQSLSCTISQVQDNKSQKYIPQNLSQFNKSLNIEAQQQNSQSKEIKKKQTIQKIKSNSQNDKKKNLINSKKQLLQISLKVLEQSINLNQKKKQSKKKLKTYFIDKVFQNIQQLTLKKLLFQFLIFRKQYYKFIIILKIQNNILILILKDLILLFNNNKNLKILYYLSFLVLLIKQFYTTYQLIYLIKMMLNH